MIEKSTLRRGMENVAASLALGAAVLAGTTVASAEFVVLDHLVGAGLTPDIPIVHQPVFDVSAVQDH